MVTELLEKEVREALGSYNIENCSVIASNRPDLCDYQFDGAFRLSKMYKKPPLEIAQQVATSLKNSPYFAKVEAVPPGFVNMTLSDCFINQVLEKMRTNEKFNLPKLEQIETYVIDYGGPNIAKPLHVGHMRPAIVGEAIKRIIAYVGHKVIADVHFGDFGLQIGQVIYGMQCENISIEEVTLED